jgi:hypothetical protein
MGTTSYINIDTYVYLSMRTTLKSISEIIKKGRINDAYALLRKFHDSAIINIYTNLYVKKNHSSERFIVDKVNNWLHGKDKLPEYREMNRYIIESEDLESIYKIFKKDDRYKKIRNRCNDNMHYNFYQNLMLNLGDVHLEKRDEALQQFSLDLKDLFILHISYLFYLNEHYMISSDYMDFLEMGMQPIEGSELYVDGLVQEVVDKYIKKNRPDIYKEILDNTQMDLT